MLPKINLEHLELLRPLGPQNQLPGGLGFTYMTLTLKDQYGPKKVLYFLLKI